MNLEGHLPTFTLVEYVTATRRTAGGVESEGEEEDAALRDVHAVHQRAVPRLLLRVAPCR